MATTVSETNTNQNDVDEFGWEKTKENFKPRAKGRNVKKLNALSENSSHVTALKEKQNMQREAFENAIVAYEGDNPIKPWLKYIKWAETEFPTSSAVAMPLYERCTRAFFKNEQYRNNIKYLTVWLKYADELDDASEVFRFLYANKIGEERSFFYIAWALVEEEKKRYPLADKIYCRGLALGAKPENVLETRHTQFKRRMSRHWLKQADEDMGRDVTERNGNNDGREAFSMLNQASAGSSRRQGTGGQIDENTGRRTGPKTGGGLGGHHNNQQQAFTDNSQVSTLGNFQIFVEEGFRAEDAINSNSNNNMVDGGDDLLKESASVPWDEFGTVDQRKKENVKTVSAWNEGGLYDESTRRRGSRNHAPRIPAVKQNAFAICVDEEFDEMNDVENKDGKPLVNQNFDDQNVQPSAKKISLRRRIEGSAKRSKEEQEVLDLKANPFKNYEGNVNAEMPNVETRLVSDPMPEKKFNSKKSGNVKKKSTKKSSKNRKKDKKESKSEKKGKLKKSKLRRKKSSNSNVTYGFNEKLLKDINTNEMCFEEQRGMKWLAKKKQKDLLRKQQAEEKAAAAKEERKKALATLQTSADDIVTEMRRKPLGARNNGRRATLCTITPNLQELYGDNASNNNNNNNNNNVSSGIWSSEKKMEAETIDVVDNYQRQQHAIKKSTARKILKFDENSTTKTSTTTKQLFFSTGGKKADEKSIVNTSMKKDTTTRKVLNFNSFANDSVDDARNDNSIFQSVVKPSENVNRKPSPKTATRRLFFTGGGETNDSVAFDTNKEDDHDNMTINMKEALDDVGGLFDDNDNSPINNRVETSTAMASIRFIEGKSLLSDTKTINNNFKIAADGTDDDDDTFGDEHDSPGTMTRDDMTLNMKAAMQDLGDLFCSPQGVLKEYIDLSDRQDNDEDIDNNNADDNNTQQLLDENTPVKKNNKTADTFNFEIFQDETRELVNNNSNNNTNTTTTTNNNTNDNEKDTTQLLKENVNAASDDKNETAQGAFQFSIFEDTNQNDENNVNTNKNASMATVDLLSAAQEQQVQPENVVNDSNAFQIYDENSDLLSAAQEQQVQPENVVNDSNAFQIYDENSSAIVHQNEPEVEVYRENQENETPPRGLSSRGRRARTLAQLQSEDMVLGELALEVVEEEEDEEDEFDNENAENENAQQSVDIPSVRRVTARARSPLQITQESVGSNNAVTDVLDVVGLGPGEVATNENTFAVAPPITRDLSDPKYDFEIFEDNHGEDEVYEEEEEEFGLIDEFGNLETNTNNNVDDENNNNNNNDDAVVRAIPFAIYNDEDEENS